MNKPKIELRKVKVLKSLSEETPCYTADVYVDGVLFCHASNHGHGGCDMHRAPKGADPHIYTKVEELNARIKATYEPYQSEFDENVKLDYDLELLCHMALGDVEVEQDLKRALSRKVLFTKQDGKVYQISLPALRHPQMIAELKTRPDVARILNDLPFADALALYKAA